MRYPTATTTMPTGSRTGSREPTCRRSATSWTNAEIRDVIAYVRSLQQTALLARDAPGPDECTVAPRTLEEFETLAQGPAPEEPPDATETRR